jgi:hypothetical protein
MTSPKWLTGQNDVTKIAHRSKWRHQNGSPVKMTSPKWLGLASFYLNLTIIIHVWNALAPGCPFIGSILHAIHTWLHQSWFACFQTTIQAYLRYYVASKLRIFTPGPIHRISSRDGCYLAMGCLPLKITNIYFILREGVHQYNGRGRGAIAPNIYTTLRYIDTANDKPSPFWSGCRFC